MTLRDKLFIKEVIEELEWQKKPLGYALQQLINEDELTTYFDPNFEATEADDYCMPNEEGNEQPAVYGNPPKSVDGAGKRITEAEITGTGDPNIAVYRFEHNGKKYCGADSRGEYLEPIILKPEDIYFDKSEIESYKSSPDSQETKPCYLDKDHEFYSPELDLAIQLHKAIYEDNYGNQNQSREDRVKSWLDKNKIENSDAKFKRLSTVIGCGKAKNK